MDSKAALKAVFGLLLVLFWSSSVYAGDIVHQDYKAPKRPGCENDFVLVNPNLNSCLLL